MNEEKITIREERIHACQQWRDDNPDEKGNIRDQATIYQLLVLANMESYNAILIKQGKTQSERMQLLHELAVQQMTTLSSLELSSVCLGQNKIALKH